MLPGLGRHRACNGNREPGHRRAARAGQSGRRRQVRRLGPVGRHLHLRRRREHARQVRRVVPCHARRREPVPAGPLERRDPAEQPRSASRVLWVCGGLPAGADRHGAGNAAGARQPFHLLAGPQRRGYHLRRGGQGVQRRHDQQRQDAGRQAGFHEERRRQGLRPGDRPALETAGQGRPGPQSGRNDKRYRRAQLHHRAVRPPDAQGPFQARRHAGSGVHVHVVELLGPGQRGAAGQDPAAAAAAGRRPRVQSPHGKGPSGDRLDGAHQERVPSRLQAGQVHHARGRLHFLAHPQLPGPGGLPASEPGVDDQGRA